MLVKRVPAGVYAANCYIIIDETTKECVILDPGGDGEALIQYIKELKVEPKIILLTHGHSDHTGAVGELCSEFNITAHIHEADNTLVENNEYMFGLSAHNGKVFKLVPDIQECKNTKIGNLDIKVIETPGHTPGGVCYLVEDKLFTGDTLFLRSIGRTDLAGGDYDTLISSINNKLLDLEDNIIVYPGHGPSSTIGFERDNNPLI